MASPLELKTDQNYIDFCTREYGWQITGPSYTRVPEPKAEYVGGNQPEFDLIKHYLTGTYIIQDQFDKDHAARRLFLGELAKSESAVVAWIEKHSKLKGNRVATGVYYPMILITENLQEHFPEKGRGLDEIQRSHTFLNALQYDPFSFEEKVAYVKSVDEVAYRFLEELVR